jgi:hypothetical protein
MRTGRRSPRALPWLGPLALVFLAASIPAVGEEKPKADDPDKILVVTKGNPGFQYRGMFYPAGMDAGEFVRLFGEPDDRRPEHTWRYGERRIAVSPDGVGPDPDRKVIAANFFLVRDPTRENDPPAKQIVTDSGIDHRSTPADVIKAHGQPTRVIEREEKRLVYSSRNEKEGYRSVSFAFKGETLIIIMVSATNATAPSPRATTVPAATTRPSR